jgi:hypothetical protein
MPQRFGARSALSAPNPTVLHAETQREIRTLEFPANTGAAKFSGHRFSCSPNRGLAGGAATTEK